MISIKSLQKTYMAAMKDTEFVRASFRRAEPKLFKGFTRVLLMLKRMVFT